jgi:hypothetical protein
MIHLFHLDDTLVSLRCQINIGGKNMDITKKRVIILIMVIVIAAILGRLAVRAIINFMLGGTMFGGNLL